MKHTTVTFAGAPNPERIREGLRIYAAKKAKKNKEDTTT